MELVAQITNQGVLASKDRVQFDDAIRALAAKRVRISVKPYQKKRSTSQNAYYWGVVITAVTGMFRDAGNYVDAEDVHEFLKMRVGKLAQAIVLPDGGVVKGLGSTARLTTTEFEVYLERIRAWAAQFGLPIPLPHEALPEKLPDDSANQLTQE